MNKKYLSFIILLFSVNSIFSQSAKEIINKAENLVKGKSAHGITEMIIATPDYERSLKMESWWVGNDKALIVIKSPRKEKGNKTLKIGNEMWNYLKNTETTIKVPPSMMLQSWNGSDFTNDDLVRESNLSDDYSQKIIGEEKLNDILCWKIKMIPNKDAAVVWGKLIYYVRKVDYLPAKVEFYDEKNVLIRYLEYSDIQQFGKRKIPATQKMVNNIKKGHVTIIKNSDMEFDINIKSRIFSFQELERGN